MAVCVTTVPIMLLVFLLDDGQLTCIASNTPPDFDNPPNLT
jgi:hypothetical protein